MTTADPAVNVLNYGTAVQDKIAIVNDRIKIVIASGGNAKSGTFHFILV